MNYRGVEFTVSMTAIPDVWKWQFQIGSEIKSGKTEAKLELLAVRRTHSQIDRELRKSHARREVKPSPSLHSDSHSSE